MNKYEPVIGLEVHVELKTKSKMFCGCSADYFGNNPNTHTCAVCLGLPGALPVPNRQAIEWCVLIGLALNCEIPLFSKFDRKNYFYPDLAKGYQISQYDQPFAINGYIDLNGSTMNHELSSTKRIRIRRVHMEEDTGKLTHATVNNEKVSLIDFNRSGVPLVEIVTEPDFSSSQEVVEYLKKLQQIVRYLNVSNADMERGDMRLEPNISLRLSSLRETGNDEAITQRDRHADARDDDTLPPYKVEVKNINSFKFVEKAIEFEIKRQAEILDKGKTPLQETRGFVESINGTKSQRVKEEANDYRYFPDPDIPPIRWNKSQISDFRSRLPELPNAKLERFTSEFKLSTYDAEILTRERTLADYFEEAVRASNVILATQSKAWRRPESDGDAGQASMTITPKQIANAIINRKINIEQILPAEIVKNIVLTSQTSQISPTELEKVLTEVLTENKKAVDDYKNGKETVIMFLVGQVMKKIGKKADAEEIKEKLKNMLTQ